MTSIQPELWVDRASQALEFYQRAFGARVLHRVGEGDEIVALLAVDEASFWVAAAGLSKPAQPRNPRWATSTVGASAGSLIRSATSGRLASRPDLGHQAERHLRWSPRTSSRRPD